MSRIENLTAIGVGFTAALPIGSTTPGFDRAPAQGAARSAITSAALPVRTGTGTGGR